MYIKFGVVNIFAFFENAYAHQDCTDKNTVKRIFCEVLLQFKITSLISNTILKKSFKYTNLVL